MHEPTLRAAALPLAVVASLLFAGCATPPAPANEALSFGSVTLPQPGAATSLQFQRDLSIERWWVLFDDPALTRLVDDALRDSHDLAAAAARVRSARAQLDERRGAQGPALELQAGHTRARQAGFDATGTQHTAALAGRYELDLWSRLASGSESARQSLLAQAWAQAALQASLAAQLADAWFALRALDRQMQISDALRESRRGTLRLRHQERAIGAASEFELRRAEAELAGSESSLAGMKRQRSALESGIALLAGRPVHQIATLTMPAAPLDVSQPFTARLPQGNAAELLARRPDIRQAEAELAAARANVSAARAATLPSIVLAGNVGSDARSLSRLFEGPGFFWSLALSASQVLFDGGQAQARVRGADARADELLASYRKTVTAALIDLRDAYAELEFSEEAQRAEQQRVAALGRARGLAQLGVRNGALGTLDLLDAERNHYQAQLAEVDALRDRLQGQVAAFKAVGGGWSPATLAKNTSGEPS
ncbi:efflux transporter outer membrane subunit [Aquincola sp. S2]|uniref:Efflux transporter outer membrane subunit n=1 Tax=Pseudaquabacterium terrae TaxID=2732868 RepID=A0ABX2EEK0_9BURK|nr:efflux transporter outer membrane subunit [Aquabacterium terrae]NRF67029.1 efflux transporter outer membrane subunit [Aquabacterium terrae]